MAPRLPPSKLHFIRDMIQDQSLTTSRMAEEAQCSERTIKNIRKNVRQFGSVHAPPNRIGWRPTITPSMFEALCEHLLEKPGLYLDEMAVFLWDEFQTLATTSSIRRALVSNGWSKKKARQIAREQNSELREYYLHNISDFQSYHLVYVDESGCDKRAGFRRTGWSPIGKAPVQVSQFHRDQRYQILPAYAQDGIVLSRVFGGSTDATIFEEFFAELKGFIKRSWGYYEKYPDQGFDSFPQRCINVVGKKRAQQAISACRPKYR